MHINIHQYKSVQVSTISTNQYTSVHINTYQYKSARISTSQYKSAHISFYQYKSFPCLSVFRYGIAWLFPSLSVFGMFGLFPCNSVFRFESVTFFPFHAVFHGYSCIPCHSVFKANTDFPCYAVFISVMWFVSVSFRVWTFVFHPAPVRVSSDVNPV